MRALALDFETRTLGWRECAEPEFFGARDVLFRVREVGVCGTDRALAAFKLGKPPEGQSHLILGHEALGQVIGVGPAVESLNRGDWVAPTVRRACHPACGSCARGRRDLCTSGRYTERGIAGLHGYFTECAVDNESDLVRVPPSLVDFGILVEPLSVVERAIARAIHVHEGEPRRALVLGAGSIGLLAALALKLRGYFVRVHSLEPPNHPRVALLTTQDIVYEATLTRTLPFTGTSGMCCAPSRRCTYNAWLPCGVRSATRGNQNAIRDLEKAVIRSHGLFVFSNLSSRMSPATSGAFR